MLISLRHFIAFVAIVFKVDGDQVGWFQNEIQTNVVPPFERAYNILNEKIVIPLLNINPLMIETDVNRTKELIIDLTCAAREASMHLYNAVNASYIMDQQLNEKFALEASSKFMTESSIGEVERKLSDSASNIKYAQENVVYIERVIQLMNTGIWPSEPIIIPANNFMALCLPGSANSAICEQAKNHYTNLLHGFQDEYLAVQGERQSLIDALAKSNRALEELRIQLRETTKLLSELRLANKVLNLIAVQSVTLVDAFKDLQDFEAVMNPLNIVYNTMHTNKIVFESLNNLITTEQIIQVENNLAKLKSLVETLLPFDVEINDPQC
jgi:hypothetical protein